MTADTDPDSTDSDQNGDCGHSSVSVDDQQRAGPEVVFWISCDDCDAYWTFSGDLYTQSASLSREDPDQGQNVLLEGGDES